MKPPAKDFSKDPINVEFVELLEATKWTQAEVAAKIHRSQGLISQYVAGSTRPSETTLQLFKRVIAAEKPSALGANETRYPMGEEKMVGMDPPEVQAGTEQLRELHVSDPKAFRDVMAEINSKVSYARQSLVKTAVAKVERGAQARRRKPKADDPTGKK